MADEQTQIPEVDPMALPENHFEQQEISAEESFLANYQNQPIDQSPGVTEQGPEGDLASDDDTDGDDSSEVFKFDDAIAESEKEELDELNAKLGTNYKDLRELKSAYQKEDLDEELQEVNQDRAYVNYFKTVLDPKEYDDRRIVFEDEKMIAQDQGRDITDPSVVEEINAKVETLEMNGVLEYAAKTIRQTVRQALQQKEAKVNAFDEKQSASKQQTEAQRKESIQDSISEIFKAGKFLGVTPTKEDMIDIYKDISNNKHIEHLKSNPKDAVEFALFKRYRSVMEKNLNKPDYKAGVKNTLASIGLTGSEQTGKRANDQGSDEGEKSYFDQFVQ